MRKRVFIGFILSVLVLSIVVGCSTATTKKDGALKNPIAFNYLNQTPLATQTAFEIGNAAAIYYPEGIKPGEEPFFPALLERVQNIAPLLDSRLLSPQFSYNKFGAIASVVLPEDVDIYGGGEVTGDLLRNKSDITLWATDNFNYIKDGGSRLYQAHPWLMGINSDGTAFGLIFSTTYPARMKVEDSTVFFIAKGGRFPLIIIEDKSPSDVLKKLALLTGKMELPPLWSLGFQQCRWSYMSANEVREIADTFREKKIPCDVIWMDIDYMDDYRIFSFDKKSFPNPTGLNSYLHKNGFKSVWMIDPGVKVDLLNSVSSSGSKQDVWIKKESGVTFDGRVWPRHCNFPDFSSPEVRSWWGTNYKAFMATGVDGVWNDMNEPSVFSGPDGTMNITAMHRGGGEFEPGTHLQYHNIYGMQMVRASKEGILNANPNKRPFLLTRSNFLGGHRYAATWTGDNVSSKKYMLESIPMSLTLGLSGQPFNGPDIGGFGGMLKGSLMARWMGTGVFFPFARAHAARGTNRKEPWSFGKDVEQSVKKSIERRYALLPYFYTIFKESSVTGLPIMRPLFMADATDKSLRDEQLAFLIGSDLMVISRFDESETTNIAQPSGDWREIRVVDEDTVADDNLAILKLRDGAILPTIETIESTVDYSSDRLILHINPDSNGNATGFLYDDRGDGFEYRSGEFADLKFSYSETDSSISLIVGTMDGDIPLKEREITLKIYNGEKARVISGKIVDKFQQKK